MIACATPDEPEDEEHEVFYNVWNEQFLKRQQELDEEKAKE